MNKKKEELFLELWNEQNIAYDLMTEYDGIPHCYGDYVLYHVEGQIIDLIAAHPGITCTDIADITNKTTSACSQIIKKLKNRKWISQVRNEKNNRKYNLILTVEGMKIYEERKSFTSKCQEIMKIMLDKYTEEELNHHIQIQKTINQAYMGDIKRSRDAFSSIISSKK